MKSRVHTVVCTILSRTGYLYELLFEQSSVESGYLYVLLFNIKVIKYLRCYSNVKGIQICTYCAGATLNRTRVYIRTVVCTILSRTKIFICTVVCKIL